MDMINDAILSIVFMAALATWMWYELIVKPKNKEDEDEGK